MHSNKKNLHYTRLINFRVSRVSDASAEAHTSRLQRWRIIEHVLSKINQI